MALIVDSKPYFFTASQPCENASYNKENTLIYSHDYIVFNGMDYNKIKCEPIIENNVRIGTKRTFMTESFIQRCHDPNSLKVITKLYEDTFEISIGVKILNGFEEDPEDELHYWYFEPEGMKSCDTFFPKGDCMNNYKLKITLR
jgi:hypothetical protein